MSTSRRPKPRREPAPALAPATESPLLDQLGARVRARRLDLSLTLRELAGRSGVSERFLVLVEGGRANISVVRLADIARALGTSASELLSDETAGTAPEADPQRPLVALLGLRGAGKTSIGEQAAIRLGVPFIELDARIAERAGMSLAEIFELHGGEYYRRLEREELEGLVQARAPGIVATGGGLVTDHAAFARLRESAVTIWLKASAEDHWNRVVAQGDIRPMANRTDAMKELRGLLRARRALYELADHEVDTSALGLSRSVDRVVKLTREAWRSNRGSISGGRLASH
ncbi:MAG: helix-turn-helix domain-containing protein [Polyangiaceae bacterium]|nr:helix-turn-helix domain-containing protein [Polyangiaceae bacterium]NUQ78818.1 helix-turn-helix domain-containing protein [Polyangiaceae bacterium]